VTFNRQEKIKSMLDEKGVILLSELEGIFPQFSSMTLRRDIESLVKDGIAIKIRGGARAIQKEFASREPVYSMRASRNIEAKIKIAKVALSYIETDRSVYLDSGSTIMCLANVLPDIKLMVLTSGPNIAIEVLKNHSPTVNLIGGLVNHDNLSVSGKQAIDFIKTVNIDIAFLCPSGFSLKDGFTCGNYNEADMKRAVIKKANRVIMLMDSNKIDKSLTFTFAELKDIDILITDAVLPDEITKQLIKSNIEIILV
jgi:DeoR/GlpR family transcriptional regulator of sugar metabolism